MNSRPHWSCTESRVPISSCFHCLSHRQSQFSRAFMAAAGLKLVAGSHEFRSSPFADVQVGLCNPHLALLGFLSVSLPLHLPVHDSLQVPNLHASYQQ